MRKLRIAVPFLALLLLIAACATFARDSYRTLSTSKSADEVALSAIGDLYKQGFVTDVQKTKAVELGRIYKQAHNSAVETLAAFVEQGGQANQQAYLTAAASAAASLAELLSYINPILTKGGK